MSLLAGVNAASESDLPILAAPSLSDSRASRATGCSDRMVDAIGLAFELHSKGRSREVGMPFIGHPWATAALVADYGGAENEVIAALLYDVVVNHPERLPLLALSERFGEEVARILQGCAEEASSQKEFLSSRRLGCLHTFAKAANSVKIVSLAHKVQSVRTIVMRVRQQPIEVRGRFNARQTCLVATSSGIDSIVAGPLVASAHQ
jgi:(p)ppGpp synthase/HD superfamily hydrolase